MVARSREDLLHRLLVSLFSPAELRGLVRWGPQGAEIGAALPGELASHDQLAGAVVLALLRYRLVTDAFFDRVVDVRPNARAEVDSVRECWKRGPVAPIMNVQVTSSGPSPTLTLDAPWFGIHVELVLRPGNNDVSLGMGVSLAARRLARKLRLRLHVLGESGLDEGLIRIRAGSQLRDAHLDARPGLDHDRGQLGGDLQYTLMEEYFELEEI